MNPWIPHLLRAGGGGGGPVLPPAGRTMLANLKSSLILDEGTGGPTWSRATKAWGFNELGYLMELASGCAFFGGARLVRNRLGGNSDNYSSGVPNSVTIVNASEPNHRGTNTAVRYAVTPGLDFHFVRSTILADDYPGGATLRSTVVVSRNLYRYIGIRAGQTSGSEVIDLQTNTWVTNRVETLHRSFEIIDANWIRLTTSAYFAATTTKVFDITPASPTGLEYWTAPAGLEFVIADAQLNNISNYDASYVPEYVSVGVEASPYFGAGIDGAKYFETDWQGAPIAAANLLRVRREASAINNLLHSRDLSNAAWSTKTNVTAAKTATGLDGIANTATTLTATAADAIILQPITLASAARCASAYVKRRTGTGTVSFTQDGGSTWTDITAQINGSTWSRVQITSTLVDPSTGFKISTSGDAIDVDCVQNEAGAVATSPIVTTTATITRNADSLSYQTAGNIDFAVGTLYCETQFTAAISTRRAVAIGADGWSYINTGDANTIWKAYDGTNIVTKSGLSDISTAKRKRVVSWGTGLTVTGDGLAPASGSFDGAFGSGASIEIGQFINGYIGPVAIYNYQMTDAELQAITA
jgi:hypothetical protein